MTKKSAQHSKGVEVQIERQMREMLWEAFPPQVHDNRKSWLARAARSLGWGQRRTKALFYCEARVVTAAEWKTLNERLNAAKKREREHEERAYELRLVAGGMGEDVPLATRESPPLPMDAPTRAAMPSKEREA